MGITSRKLFEYFSNVKIGKSNPRIESKINSVLKSVSEEIENLRYNLAIIKIRGLFEYLQGKEISEKEVDKRKEAWKNFLEQEGLN